MDLRVPPHIDEKVVDEAYLERCMELENPLEKESIKGTRRLGVCSRSSCLTHTFLCFLVVFLHVGQLLGYED